MHARRYRESQYPRFIGGPPAMEQVTPRRHDRLEFGSVDRNKQQVTHVDYFIDML